MYAEAMPPPVLTQVVASMSCIMGVEISPSPTPSTSSASGSSLTTIGAGMVETYDYPSPAPSHALPTWLLSTLPPPLLSGMEGQSRLRRLAFNCRYLARGLKKLGFLTYGHPSSPIVPLLLFSPAKMPAFSRFMLQRSTPIVVVVVGYPATPLVESRVRFCVSASHTKQDIDLVLEACDEVGDWLDLKKGLPIGKRWEVEEVKRRAVELVEMPS
jgi:serine palmitoyltransferase